MRTATKLVAAANDETGELLVVSGYVTVLVQAISAFTATMQLQMRRRDGDSTASNPWVQIGSNITALGLTQGPFLAGEWKVRVICTAYTSGSPQITLGVEERS